MKKYQVMYYAGAAISLLVGLWHFTVPWMFGWASYIPYETLVVPINYVNLCFSFLLSGLSLTVILWGKKVFAQNPEAFYLYGFLLALWIFRVVVAVIYPCPPESNVWMSYGQLGGSFWYVFCCLYRLSEWPAQGRIKKSNRSPCVLLMAKTRFI